MIVATGTVMSKSVLERAEFSVSVRVNTLFGFTTVSSWIVIGRDLSDTILSSGRFIDSVKSIVKCTFSAFVQRVNNSVSFY